MSFSLANEQAQQNDPVKIAVLASHMCFSDRVGCAHGKEEGCCTEQHSSKVLVDIGHRLRWVLGGKRGPYEEGGGGGINSCVFLYFNDRVLNYNGDSLTTIRDM